MNSCTRVEGEHHRSEPPTSPGIGPEVTVTEVSISETLTGAAFAKAAEWSGPETILLVEDEAFVRTATAEVLESAGYRLMTAGSAAEALEAYRMCSWPVDLLLCDIVMPGMNGRELATAVECLYPRARVLLMSGYAEQLAWCESSACGKQHLAKPFSISILLKRVREVLDKPVDSGVPARSHMPCGSA